MFYINRLSKFHFDSIFKINYTAPDTETTITLGSSESHKLALHMKG